MKHSFQFGLRPCFTIHRNLFLLVVSAYLSLFLNAALMKRIFSSIGDLNLYNVFFIVSFFCVLILLTLAVFLIVYWPYIGKLFLLFIVITSSITNYMMYTYGIYIDQDMVRNVVNSNNHEALDLITWSSFFWIFSTGIMPAFILGFVKIDYKPFMQEIGSRAVAIILCLVTAACLVGFFYKDIAAFGRNNREIRNLVNTGNYLRATYKYIANTYSVSPVFRVVDSAVQHAPFEDEGVTLLVIVVGETARAANFSLNGYERKTNPQLEKLDVISFKEATSCGTATAFSLPCMFSHLPRRGFDVDAEKHTENLVDLIQNSDFSVLWKDNNDGCKGVCNRIPTVDLRTLPNPELCGNGTCFDEYHVSGLRDYVRSLKKDSVLILHTLGSHGPTYYKRYPDKFKKFLPSCDTADIQNCSKEEIRNTYDNTILYTDHVISEVVNVLKEFPKVEAGMIYVSDHGESLGENNIYLHGMPYMIAPREQTHIPFIIWMSERMKKDDHINYECLREKAENEAVSHDHLYHSILSLLEIESETYDKSHDLFRSCRLNTAAERSFIP